MLKDFLLRYMNRKNFIYLVVFLVLIFIISFLILPASLGGVSYNKKSFVNRDNKSEVKEATIEVVNKYEPLDKEDYDRRMLLLANNPKEPELKPIVKKIKNPDGTITEAVIMPTPKVLKWPVKAPYPKDGAILPFNRIVAYYGNLYSKKMGILGEYSEDVVLDKLKSEVEAWTKASPETPAIPALHYIVTVAQGSPMQDNTYRARMPENQVEKVLKMAEKIDAIVFLDIQVGLSNVEKELPFIKKYLELPNVHLGLDPEFAMSKSGKKPGTVIGTMDASEINFAIDYLAKIVNDNNLPPKILMIHRFTQNMVTNYKNIKTVPEVQFVMNMDGWGGKQHKISTYKSFVYKEPVQFTGFKLFYKNDTKEKGTTVFAPEELLKLNPIPIYIQYQ